MSIELEVVVLLVEVDVMVLAPPFLVLIFFFLIMLLRSSPLLAALFILTTPCFPVLVFLLVVFESLGEGAGGYLVDVCGNAN